jgi:hypothetical protein
MSQSFPTASQVSTMLDNIEELIGIVAALPESRAEFLAFSTDEQHRYSTLWNELSTSFTLVNGAGFPVRNPNPHQTLERFRGVLRTFRESITSGSIRVRDTYSETISQLQQLRDSLHDADAPAEVIRELRESARRLNEIFIVMAFRDEMRPFRTFVEGIAGEVDLIPNFAGAHESGEALSEEILSSIRRSTIVLCDLSFERPNCYYEAGYAKGAFRHVIFTCREDHDPRKYPNGPFKVHFDVDQFRITWWDPADIESSREELIERLRDIKQQLGSLNSSDDFSTAA